MSEQNHYVALVGAGEGGKSILETLIGIHSYEVKYVCDVSDEASGMVLARQHGIQTIVIKNSDYSEIFKNHDISLVFEVTGRPEVFDILKKLCKDDCNVLGSTGTKIIFNLLDTQEKINHKLEDYQKTLETKIIERTEEVVRTNVELQEKILEYEQLNEKLMQINDQKTKYLLQATHHLKAPFAAIQSYSDLIIAGYTGKIPAQTKEIMTKIKDRSVLLQSSIKEMLELASLKSSIEENIQVSNFNIYDVLTKILEDSKILAESAKVNVKIDSYSSEVIVNGNRDQVTIMFSILVDNAIKYSNEGGNIDVVISKIKKDKICITVSDEGIGIPQKNIGKIFDEYFRCNNAVSKHANGTGLGLAITKEIANLNNFSISVDSTEGEGTTISLFVHIIAKDFE